MSARIDATNTGAGAGGDSPGTAAMRNDYDVNSPRGAGKTMSFGTAEASAGPPAGIMTQVSRADAENIQKNQQKEVEGSSCTCFQSCSTCLSCLLCGLFSSKPDSNPPPNTVGGNIEVTTAQATQQTSPAPQEPSQSDSDTPEGLLGKKDAKFKGKKCLVLDLDETLVHSSFKPVPDADFIVPVEIEGTVYNVYVLKRPFVDEFLTAVAEDYEVVIFTASLSKYANPLLDMLDKNRVVSHRLFRESCVMHGQAYVKDMSKLGRKMKDIIIVDNSPLSYAFQPTSAIPITSWFEDRTDRELKELIPVLRTTLKDIPDVRDILDANNKSYKWLCNQATSASI